ncbi:MAG TPA: hypothetical protein VL284_05530 [Thermoanaerobaculia bacterium]|nr:hypothetical protein [Thermoanaerobaculia bacterium]
MNDERSLPAHRSSFIVVRSLLIVALFFVLRVPLLLVRAPFFDELFTRWIAAKSFGGILAALRHDSGPPLYYFLVHLAGDPSIAALRGMSLLFATIALAALLVRKHLVAAALLAAFPPAVLLSVDARSYALCAMFVTIGVLALAEERAYVAAIAFVLAAYSHYYGALFFPLLPFAGYRFPSSPRNRRQANGNWLAFGLAIVLFSPGVWLALHQPRESVAWIGASPRWPEALFAQPPLWLLIVAALLFFLAAYPWNRFTLMTLVPLAIALVVRIYFPLRFESVIAAPLVLWLATSARRILIAPLIAVGIAICAIGIIDHAHRPVDDYRAAAEFVRNVPGPIVASGYLYLETISLRPAIAFPPEQAEHPGWRATAAATDDLPRGAFVWIGERYAPELRLIERSRRVTPLYLNGRAAVVRVN